VSKKRSRLAELKAFGAKLKALRGGRSREQISLRLQTLGVTLDESTLVQYEKGTVWAPDAGVLWGLAVIYNQSLTDLIGLLLLNRQNPDASVGDADMLFANARGFHESERLERLLGTRLPHQAPVTEAGKRIDLARHSADQASTPSGGGDVPASRESAPVPYSATAGEEVSELKTRLSAAEDAAVFLLSIITGEEVSDVHATRRGKTQVRGRHRSARR